MHEKRFVGETVHKNGSFEERRQYFAYPHGEVPSGYHEQPHGHTGREIYSSRQVIRPIAVFNVIDMSAADFPTPLPPQKTVMDVAAGGK
jgi:hypothetical protein